MPRRCRTAVQMRSCMATINPVSFSSVQTSDMVVKDQVVHQKEVVPREHARPSGTRSRAVMS